MGAHFVLCNAASAFQLVHLGLVLVRLLARLLDVMLQVEHLPEVEVRLQSLLRRMLIQPSEADTPSSYGISASAQCGLCLALVSLGVLDYDEFAVPRELCSGLTLAYLAASVSPPSWRPSN